MKAYKKPVLNVEHFVANEFVAACGDTIKKYQFKCNAPEGTLYYYPTSDGSLDGNYTGEGRARILGSYNPCGKTHEVSVQGAFYDGFVDYNKNGIHDEGEGVIVYRETFFGIEYQGHATKELDVKSWETTGKS